ncbi:MAG TPA: hypothetical protein VMW82_02360 [Candidatus Paceibacterota bacterium]|nr:hypothetical protein [Candidatus Paceibacterota bacterium]
MEQQLNTEQSESKPKRKKIITVVIFFVIIVAIIYLGWIEGSRWWQEKQKWVKFGLAEDKFPFRMYTEKELVERGLWSGESEWYNSIPTRTTPEETYAIFRKALMDGDLDKAAECFIEEKQAEYRQDLERAKTEGRIPEVLKQLTELYPRGTKIVKGTNDTNLATYEIFIIENGQKISNPIPFTKDKNGDWKLEDL